MFLTSCGSSYATFLKSFLKDKSVQSTTSPKLVVVGKGRASSFYGGHWLLVRVGQARFMEVIGCW